MTIFDCGSVLVVAEITLVGVMDVLFVVGYLVDRSLCYLFIYSFDCVKVLPTGEGKSH